MPEEEAPDDAIADAHKEGGANPRAVMNIHEQSHHRSDVTLSAAGGAGVGLRRGAIGGGL